MKNQKRIIMIVAVIILVITSAVFVLNANGKVEYEFETVKVAKSSISNTVTATGTLEATNTVIVGTQVSGVIEKIYVDFNSKVTKGQLLAELDKSTLQSSLENAEADVSNSEAEKEYQEANFARMQEFFPDVESMRGMIAGFSFSDEETRDGVKEIYEKFDYVACPHTTVGALGLKAYMGGEDRSQNVEIGNKSEIGNKHEILNSKFETVERFTPGLKGAENSESENCLGIVLATAHPAKFHETVEACTGVKVEIPEEKMKK